MSSEIGNWYSGKNILITGGTGYIGKVLLEKLLRTCHDIGKIYLFIRPKKGKTTEERKNIIFENPIFASLRDKYPNQLNKVQLINGSLSKDGLNLSISDEFELRENCNLVFHAAASIQFDLDLREISDTNFWGLKYVLDLAKNMKQLNAFVLCSTAFSQYYEIVMEERRYEPPISSKILEKFLNQFNDDIINPLTQKLLGRHANTYVFTKAIGENLIENYSNFFPIAIARPSVVTHIWQDPIPGWTEGLHGVNGLFVACLFGVIKVIYGVDTNPRSGVPVDIASNALITIGWQTGLEHSNEINYYNVAEDTATSSLTPASKWSKDAEYAGRKYPLDIAVMHFGYRITTNYFIFKLMTIWYHYIPAIIIDSLLLLFQKKPMLIRVHRKILHNFLPIQYYKMNGFVFKTHNFYELSNRLNDVDRKLFPMDIEKALDRQYYVNGQLGYRRYLLKQQDENIAKARKLQLYLYIFGRIIYATSIYYVFRLIYIVFF